MIESEDKLIRGWETWTELIAKYDIENAPVVVISDSSPYMGYLRYVHQYLSKKFDKAFLISDVEIDFWENDYSIILSKDNLTSVELYYRVNRFHKDLYILEDENYLSIENYRILQTFSIEDRLKYGILKEEVDRYDGC